MIDSVGLNQELQNLRGNSDDDKESVNSQTFPIRKHSADAQLEQLNNSAVNTTKQALSEGNASEKD